MAQLDQLNAQLSTAEKNIEILITNIERLKREIGSGDWGTVQIAQMNREILSLKESLANWESKKLQLVDKQSVRDLESVLKSIDTLQTKLAGKRQAAIDLRETGDPGLQAVLRDIKNAENALKAFQSRAIGGFSPLTGYKRTDADAAPFNIDEQTSKRIEVLSGARAAQEQLGAAMALDTERTIAAAKVQEMFNAALLRTDELLGKVSVRAAGGTGFSGGAGTGAPMGVDTSLEDAYPGNRKPSAAAQRAAEEENIQRLRRKALSTDEQYKRVWQEIVALKMQDAKFNITKYSKGGVTQVTATKVDEAGTTLTRKFGVDESGNVTPNIPRAYQTFLQGIVRDFRELTKWSVAIALIYGPMNALQGLMQKMIENEAKLAQVSIALNTSLASQDQVFHMVADTAQAAGEELGGVIDAFDQAYRATGRIADQTTRLTTTTQLLTDAITLSKISTLDQAESIDILTASLYQASMPLSDGATLLDQWVTVSKNAAVDVATLAQGVAILGDSAENAGLNTKELNAMIATMVETSNLAGKEAANAAKALIGQYQSPEAVKALGQLGIAVKDTTGKTREYLDVMKDVAALRTVDKQTGVQLLGNEAFSALTLQLGGQGIRRQKDVSNFIENLGRMQQLVAVQENAQGASAEALAKTLDTAQTSVTRLGNAFQMLGQALGSEGGLLTTFADLVDLTTALVTGLSKLTEELGTVGPLLYAVGIAGLVSGRSGGVMGTLLGKFNPIGVGPLGSLLAGQTLGQSSGLLRYTSEGVVNQKSGFDVSSLLMNPRFLGAMAGIIPAIGNFRQGNAGAGIGDIIGAGLGYAAAGPGGALIGAAIADAFVTNVLQSKGRFSDLFAGRVEGPPEPGTATKTEDMVREGYAKIGRGSEVLGNAIVFLNNIAERKGIGFTGFKTKEAALFDMLKREDPALYNRMQNARTNEGDYTGIETPLSKAQYKLATEAQVQYLFQMQMARQQEMRGQLYEGKIKPTEYTSQMGQLANYPVTATRYMAAFGDEFAKITTGINNTTDAYKAFLDMVSYGSEEQLSSLASIVSEIDKYQTMLATWNEESAKSYGMSRAQVQALLQETILGAATAANKIYTTASVGQINMPPIQSLTQGAAPTNVTEWSKIMGETHRLQREYYSDIGMTTEQINALEASFEEFSVYLEDGGKTFYDTINDMKEGIDKNFISPAIEKLTKQGLISNGDIGIQSYSATQREYQQAVAAYPGELRKLVNLGYKPQEEPQIVKLSDSDFFADRKDFKVMQLILQRIADLNQKQLDGMYNIPEGATFWVPITAAYYRPQNNELGDVSGTTEDINALGTAASTAATRINAMVDRYGRPTTGPSSYPHGPVAMVDEYGRGTTGPSSRPWQDRIDRGAIVQNEYKQPPTFLENLKNFFGSVFGGTMLKPWEYSPIPTLPRDIGGGQTNVNPVTKLDLRFESTTQLMVDGRILASIIKPYLAADLLQSQQTQSAVTRRYII